jgi:hypothetical protein
MDTLPRPKRRARLDEDVGMYFPPRLFQKYTTLYDSIFDHLLSIKIARKIATNPDIFSPFSFRNSSALFFKNSARGA